MGSGNGCGRSLLKIFMVIFNIAFLIIGIALLALGAYILVDFNTNYSFVKLPVTALAVVILVFGLITVMVAGLGCLGAFKESPCLLYAFAACVLVIILVEIIAGAVAFTYRTSLEKELRDTADDVAADYYAVGTIKTAFDKFMTEFKCCGINNVTDFQKVNSAAGVPRVTTIPNIQNVQNVQNVGNTALPAACTDVSGLLPFVAVPGCVDRIRGAVEANYLQLGGAAIGLAIAQLVGIIIALCLAKSIKGDAD